ncbi:MAG: long-chain fatty acid--CoA ligase [Candidatus Schekmanbacteria bacterium]|nr:long-chain fatty acid--CoA ligase [Candidatus Schekmanbacteria bacterium]
MSADTIPARFLEHARIRPEEPAYYVRENGSWHATSWRDYVAETRRAARAMVALGLEPGDTVCILGFNKPEWVVFDIAAMLIGGVPAGIYTTCSPGEVQYIVHHAEAKLVLVENEQQWQKINAERQRLPSLQKVVFMRGAAKVSDPLALAWSSFLALADGVPEEVVDKRSAALEPDQKATFIYTSGTTGPPKAVMLSHRNLSWTATTAVSMVEMQADACSLSYLPLSHIAEQMFTIHGPISAGSAVYFAESIDKLPDNLREVQPHIFFGVPRIWEKFHAGVSEKLNAATGIKALLAGWARGVGTHVSNLRNRGSEPAGLLALQYKIANALVFSKLKPRLGLGRARMLVTGAAPIAKEVLEFFASLDIVVREVYGQSEDCGPTSFNGVGKTKFGTVGVPLPSVDVKIADDGEIIVRGPNVFLGYYKDQAATDSTLRGEWLHSGDLGELDKDGFLLITGRKKDIIITSGGKNIAPANIESALKNLELVSEAVVIGDKRNFLSALITLDPDAAARFAERQGVPVSEVHANPALIAEIQRGVDTVNEQFARVEHVRKLCILKRSFTVEDGELTPTLKVKRKVVFDHFSKEIEGMYTS